MDNKTDERVNVYNQNTGNIELHPINNNVGYQSNQMIPNNMNVNVISNLA